MIMPVLNILTDGGHLYAVVPGLEEHQYPLYK